MFSRSAHFSIQPKQNRWPQPSILARSFGSTSPKQIQQASTAAGLESASSLLPSADIAAGSVLRAAPGGGFFRLLRHFGIFLRLPLGGADGAFRFLEGAEAGGKQADASVDLSRVLICERFRDLVAGLDPAAASSRAPTPTENELFVLAADVDPVKVAILRVRD